MREIKIAGVVKALFGRSPDTAPTPPLIDQDNLRRHWSEPCCKFIDYWASLRRGAMVPTFEAFSDTMSRAFTPSCYVVELVDESVIVRFQGTELVERWQIDLTGLDIHDSFSHYFRSRSYWNMRNVVDRPCGLLGRATYLNPRNRAVTSDSIHLPLAMADGRPSRLVHYSAKITPGDGDEGSLQYFKTHKYGWLDIGAGIPATPPLVVDAKQQEPA